MEVVPFLPSDLFSFLPHLDIHSQPNIAHWSVSEDGTTSRFCQPNLACSRLWPGLPSFLQRKKPEDFSFWLLARLWLSASSQLWLETWLLHAPRRRIVAEAPPEVDTADSANQQAILFCPFSARPCSGFKMHHSGLSLQSRLLLLMVEDSLWPLRHSSHQ